MNTIPTPKYNIGDTVYTVHESNERVKLPCPDCHDTQKWTTTSPAGNTMDADCPRCTRHHYNDARLDLYRNRRSYYVKACTVGSVRIDTHNYGDSYREPVEYMLHETGVGSGTVWGESRLYATKEEADAEGARKAEELQLADDSTPEAVEHLKLCGMPFLESMRQVLREQVKRDVREQMADELGDLGYAKHDGPAMGHWAIQAGYSEGAYDILLRDPKREFHSGARVCEVRGSNDTYGYNIRVDQALATAVLLRAAPTMLKAIKAALDGDASGLETAYAFATTMPELPE